MAKRISPSAKKQVKAVDGNNVLYHYLQKDLLTSDVWLFQMLVARLITDLGIWFHPQTYMQMPLLLPYVVRDPTCRKSVGGVEDWGAPNDRGYFRDDNSLIKSLGKALVISQNSEGAYAGKKLGVGFTACHVWRRVKDDDRLASRLPELNSFIPNLVWLPSQVAKLTDREASFAQTYLQALSWKIYRQCEVSPSLSKVAEQSWGLLEKPVGIPDDGLPAIQKLNFFEYSEAFIEKRIRKLKDLDSLLQSVTDGLPIEKKSISTRYDAGIRAVRITEVRILKKMIEDMVLNVERGRIGNQGRCEKQR